MEASTGDRDRPMIFHICAKGIYSKKVLPKKEPSKKINRDKWNHREIIGYEDMVISSMSYSVCVGYLPRHNGLWN